MLRMFYRRTGVLREPHHHQIKGEKTKAKTKQKTATATTTKPK